MRPLVYRWFVRYNPLYFFSALCILSGVFLVSREDLLSRVLLIGVVQAYEGLLMAAAVSIGAGLALLFGGFVINVAASRRPARFIS